MRGIATRCSFSSSISNIIHKYIRFSPIEVGGNHRGDGVVFSVLTSVCSTGKGGMRDGRRGGMRHAPRRHLCGQACLLFVVLWLTQQRTLTKPPHNSPDSIQQLVSGKLLHCSNSNALLFRRTQSNHSEGHHANTTEWSVVFVSRTTPGRSEHSNLEFERLKEVRMTR